MISGIYAITNTLNGKIYYGSSVNMESRKRQHWSDLRNNKHKNPHLQASWNLHGESVFRFDIIEEVPSENLVAVEQLYLDKNKNGYNIGKFADVPARGLKRSIEQRAKMSKSQKGKKLSDSHKKALSLAGKGKKRTDEQRSAMSNRMKGRKLSDATKTKLTTIVTDKWKESEYRDKTIKSQQAASLRPEVKSNRSTAMVTRWSDIEQKQKLSDERKSRWENPEYRAKMLVIRKEQGKRFSGENWRERPKNKGN